MSANAEFSTTLDYEFTGGGNVLLSSQANVVLDFSILSNVEVLTVTPPNGIFSGNIDYSVNSTGKTLVTVDASNVIEYDLTFLSKAFIVGQATSDLSFDFYSRGGYKPIEAQTNVFIGFTLDAALEFGIQTRGFANNRIEFTQTALGNLPIRVSANIPFEFSVQSSATQFSLGTANLSFDFSVDSNVLNYSLHVYDRIGKNEVELVTYEFNNIEILNEKNFIEIIDSGRNEAKILSY